MAVQESDGIELSERTPFVRCTLVPGSSSSGSGAPAQPSVVYLVIGRHWVVLVEPSPANPRRGVARSVMPVHRCEARIETTNTRAMHLTCVQQSPVGCATALDGARADAIDRNTGELAHPLASPPARRPDRVWHLVLLFDNSSLSREAKRRIDGSMRKLRAAKLNRIAELLLAPEFDG
jgi:hypothetical protein